MEGKKVSINSRNIDWKVRRDTERQTQWQGQRLRDTEWCDGENKSHETKKNVIKKKKNLYVLPETARRMYKRKS